MPGACVSVSSWDRQSDRVRLSRQNQPRVEQRSTLGADYRRSSMWLSIFVYPFYCVVDSDCDGDVDGIWIGARREFCLELGQVETGRFDVGSLGDVYWGDSGFGATIYWRERREIDVTGYRSRKYGHYCDG